MKILLAVDGSEYGKAAADSVAGRPWPVNSVIKVLSAVEPPYYPTTETWVLPENYYAEMESAGKEQAESAVNYAAETLRAKQPAQVEIISLIRGGAAKEVILDEAKHWGADLIIVGSHGYRALQRLSRSISWSAINLVVASTVPSAKSLPSGLAAVNSFNKVS
jgi:nucleotide-binding universal stress UspA family protein